MKKFFAITTTAFLGTTVASLVASRIAEKAFARPDVSFTSAEWDYYRKNWPPTISN